MSTLPDIHPVPGGGVPRSEAERSEAERSGMPPLPSPARPAVPDPEVRERPARRRFTAEYKLRILRLADACGPGELGALLRREGLYSSHLTGWRRQRDVGASAALVDRRGRRKQAVNPLAGEVARLQRENRRIEHRLKRAEAVIEFQKKVADLLAIPLQNPDDEGNN